MTDVDERDVRGTTGAAEVGAVEAVAEGGGGEVVHEPERAEARDGGGVEVGLALRLREVARDGDDAVGYGRLEVGLRELPEVPEQHGEELGRGERDAAADVVDVDEDAAASIRGGGLDGEGEAREVAAAAGEQRGAAREEEEALDAGEGACDEAAPAAWGPRRRALWEKATAAGDSRLDSALRSTSMPRCRAAAATRVSLPTSKPTTLIAPPPTPPELRSGGIRSGDGDWDWDWIRRGRERAVRRRVRGRARRGGGRAGRGRVYWLSLSLTGGRTWLPASEIHFFLQFVLSFWSCSLADYHQMA